MEGQFAPAAAHNPRAAAHLEPDMPHTTPARFVHTDHALKLQIAGMAWGGFEAVYAADFNLDRAPTADEVTALRAALAQSPRAPLGDFAPGKSADFGDFQRLTDCRIVYTARTFEQVGRAETLETVRTRTLKGWTRKSNARAMARSNGGE